jgi:hypothetical protein
MCYRRPDGHCLGLSSITIIFHNKNIINVDMIHLLLPHCSPIPFSPLLLSPKYAGTEISSDNDNDMKNTTERYQRLFIKEFMCNNKIINK